jgi:ribonuclease R
MDLEHLQQLILKLVTASGFRPMKPRGIAKELGITDEQRSDLKKAIKKLIKRGQLQWGPGHLVQPVGQNQPTSSTSASRLSGTMRRTKGGFGFVRPQGVTPGDASQDVYISSRNCGDASQGDLVLVRLKPGLRRQGNREGRVTEILERDTHQFVGTYFEAVGGAFVQVDGTVFQKPVSVGDPGAKRAVAGDKVVFEMVRFPSHMHDGEGVITEVLGPRGEVGVDTLSIIREFDLPEEFAEDAQEEARRIADEFKETIQPDRLDLTGETIITIDPRDARDFDDAISLKRLENGHWRLGVHIADVSYFVRPGTALDREAYDRGTSVYLPDRVLPMLPEVISNALASLQPEKLRYTKTAVIEFTAEGAPVAVDLHTAAIRSCRRFTYEEVDEYLADPEAWKEKLTPDVQRLLGDMHRLAMILRQRRFERGALELSMNDLRVDLDQDGRVVGAHFEENTESHQIIEEFMLSANEGVARTLAKAEYDFLRRVHDDPEPRKLKALTEFVADLGLSSDNLQSRFELQDLLKRVRGCPEERAVNFALLRSLPQAVYSPMQVGHYALASDCYCHFTSPIRRYPDLTIHRLIDLLLIGKRSTLHEDELGVIGEHCSGRERRAEAAERELTKVKLLNYLSDRIGETFDAVVTGVQSFGLFAQGLELPAEGMIHVSALSDDEYRYDPATHTLSGFRGGNSFRLGDVIRVAVASVDVDRRQLDFRVLARTESAGASRKQSAGNGKQAQGRAGGPPFQGTQSARGASGPNRAGSKKPAKHKQRSKGKKRSNRRK